MIAFDSSEEKGLSADVINRLRMSSGCMCVPWLEELTGADVLVSAFGAPLLPATLPLHMENRALLIQVKYGEDLLDSAGFRLNESLARMIEVSRAPWQRILLPVGMYTKGEAGAVLVGLEKPTSDPNKPFVVWWKSTRSSWAVYESITRRWCFRGGVVMETVKSADGLAQFLTQVETDLRILEPVKEFYQPLSTMEEVDPASPIQELRPVKDWRRVLAALPGIGPTKINALVETFNERQLPLTGAIALEWALESPLLPSAPVPGWGKKTRATLRKFMGFVDDAQTLTLMNVDPATAKALEDFIKQAETEFPQPDLDNMK